MNETVGPVEVFYSYAHEDEKLRDELEKHLSTLKRQEVISGWNDRDITAGSQWQDQIDQHLESAKIILLLVSADFLSSNYCYDIEMKRALERHERGETRVIPLILRPVDWQGAPFGKLQALPKDGIAVTSWPNRDEAFLDIVQGIRKAAQAMGQGNRAGQIPAPPAISTGVTAASQAPEPPKRRWMKIWDGLTETNMKKLAFLGGLIAAISAGFWTVYSYRDPTVVQTDENARMITQGNDLLNIGRYPKAKEAFEEALKAHPLSAQAAWGLKKARLWELSDAAEFEQMLKNLYRENPQDAHLNLFMGKFYASRHSAENIDEAIKYYRTAIQRNPALAEAYFDLGVIFDQSGKSDQAESAYKKAVDISENNPKYRNNLAYLYFKQKNYSKALEEYGKNSQFPLSALERGKIFWRLGDMKQALEHQRLALQWLDDEKLMTKPEQQDPWYFEIGKRGIELISINEKEVYADLCLSFSQFLLGDAKSAEGTIHKLGLLNVPRQSEINAIMQDDLANLTQAKPEIAAKVEVYKNRFPQTLP